MLAMGIDAGCASPGEDLRFVEGVAVATPLDVPTASGYPQVPYIQRQGAGGCALMWMDASCLLVGLRGPVKKVSLRDEFLKVLDSTVEFDRSGTQAKICQRGHTDFEGWSCAMGKDRAVARDTRLDDAGRVIMRPGIRDRIDRCKYDDLSDPPTSVCDDGYYTHRYSYDHFGRPATYTRTRIPQSDETPERSRQLSEILEIRYVYVDDKFGNWIEVRMIYGGASTYKSSQDVVRHRTIEYY